MNIFQKIIKHLYDSYCQEYDEQARYAELLKEEIVGLRVKLTYIEADFDKCVRKMNSTTKELETKTSNLARIKSDYFVRTLDEFKEYLIKNVPTTTIGYSFRGSLKDAHEHYQDFSKDDVMRGKFLVFLQKFIKNSPKFDNADTLIYNLNLYLDKHINAFDKPYQSDMTIFKEFEHWMSPEEVYSYYVDKKIAGDCDDTGTFKHCCFVTALIYYGFWSDCSWRLRTIIVNVITGGNHYVLAWVKEDSEGYCRGWIPLETTYYKSLFEKIWKNNIQLRDNVMYKILWSFDEEAEYRRIE